MKRIKQVFKKNFSKIAVCTNLLLIASAMIPNFGSACYIYWHHAPSLPHSLRSPKE